MSDTIIVTRADWEALKETVQALTYGPSYSHSQAKLGFKLACGVEAKIHGTSIAKTSKGNFYGNPETYTHVQLSYWIWDNTTLTGKGSRGEEAHKEIREIMGLLSNKFQG